MVGRGCVRGQVIVSLRGHSGRQIWQMVRADDASQIREPFPSAQTIGVNGVGRLAHQTKNVENKLATVI